jgi:hypothetical protein
MSAGMKGLKPEQKKDDTTWDNTAAYEEWVQKIGDEAIVEQVKLKSTKDYVDQRCDIRDMRSEVGLPKFEPLESQVFTAWIEEGVKDDKMAEVLGLSLGQVRHVMAVVRMRLKKQMAYYQEVKKLTLEAEEIKKRKGL